MRLEQVVEYSRRGNDCARIFGPSYLLVLDVCAPLPRGPRPTVDPAHADFAVLRSLYDWKSRLPDADPDWQALLRHTAVTPSGDFAIDWGQVQTALRQEVATTLNDLGRTHDVVLMIHGYNNDHKAAQGWYQQAENGLRDAARGNARPLAFVRMYWDGLEGRTPFFVWTRAQYNGPLVGLELRRILALVEPHVPLRAFTHSSGAVVIANAPGGRITIRRARQDARLLF